MFKLHLDKLGKELQHLQEIGPRIINAPNSTFATDEIEYLGYAFTLYGIHQNRKGIRHSCIATPYQRNQLHRVRGIITILRIQLGEAKGFDCTTH